jgi:GNAT superfamily N-acetyltransferase
MKGSLSAAEGERVEAESYAAFEDSAPAAAKAALGMRQMRIGGGVALAVPVDPTGYWSRAVGLGFREPLTGQLLEQVIDFYREQGMSATSLPIAPRVLPPDWDDIRAKLNICEPASAWVKLGGDLAVMAEIVNLQGGAAAYLDGGLRLATVTADRAREWATMTWEVFFGSAIEHQVEMGVGSVGSPGWHMFAVLEGDDIVAGGGLRAVDGVGHLFGGATLPHARGRGAQSALIAARVLAARAAGCAWLVGEAGAEGPGEHNPSLHNMLRAGMSARYERPNWTWRAAGA